MPVGVWLAVAAAVAWGTADFCAQRAASRLGWAHALFGVNAVGGLVLGAAATGPALRSLGDVRYWLALAAANTVAGVLFYFALQHGRLSLVSPITAGYPVVSVALAYAVAHERLRLPLAAAVGGVIIGTLLAASGAGRGPSRPRERPALGAAVAGAAIFGFVFYGFRRAGTGAAAVTAPILLLRWVGAVLLGLPLLLLGRRPERALGSRWVWAAGLLDSGAYLLYVAGLAHIPVAIAAPVAGLFTVWTLLLAGILLRERLNRRQWCGVALIVAAVAILARA